MQHANFCSKHGGEWASSWRNLGSACKSNRGLRADLAFASVDRAFRHAHFRNCGSNFPATTAELCTTSPKNHCPVLLLGPVGACALIVRQPATT